MITKSAYLFVVCVFFAVSQVLGAETPLHKAAKDGDLKMVKSLVEQGSEVNAKNEDFQTPLHVAIRFGNFEVAKYLTEKGADINATDGTERNPLMCAAEAGVVQMSVQPFSSSATEGGFKPYEGQIEMVRFLVEKGAKVDAANQDGATPLIAACDYGLFQLADYLISKGANVNATIKSGQTALYLATFGSHTNIVELLLKKGANPNAAILEEGPGKGQTPLMVAAGKGNVEIVKLLLQNKADVNAKDGSGYTALKYTKNEEIVKLLKNAPTVPSSPPTGQWKAVEERSNGFPTALVVRFDEYSSDADTEAVAESAKRGECKVKIESFQSHGAIMVGRQLGSMMDGTMWIPNFVTAKQLGDTWKITIVSGSPFVEKEKAEPEDVGLIELTVPVKGDGGTAKLYMSINVIYDKGLLIPKSTTSKSTVLKITSFLPSEKETVRPLIPAKFIGSWTEKGNDGKVVSELKIETNQIEWTRTDEDKDIVMKYAIEDGGEMVSFDSKVTYSRSVLGGKAYKGDVRVKMRVKDDTLTVEIGGMKVQEQPGVTVTRLPEEHQYKKVVAQK